MAVAKPKQRHGAPDATKLQAFAEKASQVGRGGWSFADGARTKPTDNGMVQLPGGYGDGGRVSRSFYPPHDYEVVG